MSYRLRFTSFAFLVRTCQMSYLQVLRHPSHDFVWHTTLGPLVQLGGSGMLIRYIYIDPLVLRSLYAQSGEISVSQLFLRVDLAPEGISY